MATKANRGISGRLTQEALLNRMTNRIRQSLELEEILTATVHEMREFLGMDRVKIYRFQPDYTGQVVAESVDTNRLPTLIGLFFPSEDIPAHAREIFIKARHRSIVDVVNQRITTSNTLSQGNRILTTGDLTLTEVQNLPLTDILQRPVDPCHIKYLTNMGVQSSLVIPIMDGERLWGLLAAHHAQPKQFSPQQLQIVQLLTDQVSIAIAQSHLLTQARDRAHTEGLINQISTLLHEPQQIQETLQIVLERIVRIVDGSGGRLYLTSIDRKLEVELYTFGSQPDVGIGNKLIMLEDYPFWQELIACHDLSSARRIPLGIANIYEEESLAGIAPLFTHTQIRSLVVMPLQYAGKSLGCMTIFRDQIDTDITWAGKFDPDLRQDIVRESFEAWRELKRGQAKAWTTSEIALMRSLSTHMEMAIMQNRLFQYEREQRLLVEKRNHELSAAQSIAEEANRLKSDFLSSTSHELRTPLASIINYLKLVKEGFYETESELKEYISVAFASAENLVAIINDILDIAKIESGRMSVNLELVNLTAILNEQSELFRVQCHLKGVGLVVKCEIDYIYADRLKLSQVIANLLSNAVKFTSAGTIQIKVIPNSTSPGDWVDIAVIDTGIGVELQQQPLLFEPFVQADGSIKRRYGGTGLGLTICRRLTELMGGVIQLSSPGKGQGTGVVATLPRSESVYTQTIKDELWHLRESTLEETNNNA
jgi:light-regulated signal transduction histidine kinase (bacteriophytochrome)